MDAQLTETLRRQWPVLGALALFLLFALAHALVFQPTARRYDAAAKRAGELGLAFDPAQGTAVLPPRVFALLTDHALSPNNAQERAGSGALTASLLEDLNKMASGRGLSVLVTEPGPITQLPQSVEVRAHLRMRGSYAAFAGFLGEVAKSGSLIAIERFTIQPGNAGGTSIELWVGRYLLKQTGGTP